MNSKLKEMVKSPLFLINLFFMYMYFSPIGGGSNVWIPLNALTVGVYSMVRGFLKYDLDGLKSFVFGMLLVFVSGLLFVGMALK